jgi:hypothetical protein
MPRPQITLREQLAKLEQKTNDLLLQRQSEFMNIFKACKAVTIDDTLLTGFLLFASNPDNKDSPVLKEFLNLVKTNKMPSKRKFSASNKPKKSS